MKNSTGDVSLDIVSSSALFAECLARRLAEEGLGNPYTAGSFGEAMDAARRAGRKIDAIILHNQTGSTLPVAETARLRRDYPQARLMLVHPSADLPSTEAAFVNGAHAMVSPDISSDALILSIRLMLAGEKVLPSALADAITDFRARKQAFTVKDTAYKRLTERERHIVSRIADGSPNKLIAHELNLSESVVKGDVKSMLRKLAVTNRTQLAICAYRLGWTAAPFSATDMAV